MDLIATATAAAEAHNATQESLRAGQREKAMVDGHDAIKAAFSTLLDVNVTDDDILHHPTISGLCGVVVDGVKLVLAHHLAVGAATVQRRTGLAPYYVGDDGAWYPLGGTNDKVYSMADLGRLLAGDLLEGLPIGGAGAAAGERRAYRPGVGLVLRYKDGRIVDPPRPVPRAPVK